MEDLVKLWEEFEEWHADNFPWETDKPPVVVPTPTFAQFIAWYRDVYPLKSPLN